MRLAGCCAALGRRNSDLISNYQLESITAKRKNIQHRRIPVKQRVSSLLAGVQAVPCVILPVIFFIIRDCFWLGTSRNIEEPCGDCRDGAGRAVAGLEAEAALHPAFCWQRVS